MAIGHRASALVPVASAIGTNPSDATRPVISRTQARQRAASDGLVERLAAAPQPID